MQLPVLAWLLQGVPECLACTALVMIIVTGRLQWEKIIIIGLCLAVLVYLVRLLPITYGVHTILSTILLAVLVTKIGKARFIRSLAGALFAVFVIAITESFSHWLIFGNGVVTQEDMASSVYYGIVMGLPQIVTLSLLAFIFKIQLKGKCTEI